MQSADLYPARHHLLFEPFLYFEDDTLFTEDLPFDNCHIGATLIVLERMRFVRVYKWVFG